LSITGSGHDETGHDRDRIRTGLERWRAERDVEIVLAFDAFLDGQIAASDVAPT
jgi:hypothetical protein